ncbi:hypothetical protein EJ06DRAFT_243851 [Trichodelitschia bisporula]|uniref:T6SS Phospholipase effector Tle1-like catalytic domain-containing protein n=1 Tax=Trichodelitschia bisporula TaxID=703511 RepID=A0A6G1HK19_9PEZI|nr:hypothetical protein EJ06DRAFT_243851 [Trichodelitschia bisporula]
MPRDEVVIVRRDGPDGREEYVQQRRRDGSRDGRNDRPQSRDGRLNAGRDERPRSRDGRLGDRLEVSEYRERSRDDRSRSRDGQYEERETYDRDVAVLVDRAGSMQIRDGERGGRDRVDREGERVCPRRYTSQPYKRLIICADGTWLDSDNGNLNGEIPTPSNVTRLARAIKAESDDNVPQVVSYHSGVGSHGSIINRVVAGAVGVGLAENVRESYSFLANNYTPGDEIFIFGFSRGAFTARSIAGLIGAVGLLTKRGLPYLPEIFRDVRHRHDPHYQPMTPDQPYKNKPSASDPSYKDGLARRGMTILDVDIKVVGVWDTVGSLGLPRIPVLTRIGIQGDESREMSFWDTKLSDCIENAFQALALEERRTAFAPAVWEKPRGNRTRLRQVWFPGVHSNVGGGLDDQNLANISLAWMLSQIAPFLDIQTGYIRDQAIDNHQYYLTTGRKPRPWGFGKITNSMKGVYAIGGGTARHPGEYYAVDKDGHISDRPLRDTHEYVHASVRVRMVCRGPGVDDNGPYDPDGLADWKLVVEYPDGPRGRPEVYWRARFEERNVSTRVLPEAPLWGMERELLGFDREMERVVLWPERTGRRGG